MVVSSYEKIYGPVEGILFGKDVVQIVLNNVATQKAMLDIKKNSREHSRDPSSMNLKRRNTNMKTADKLTKNEADDTSYPSSYPPSSPSPMHDFTHDTVKGCTRVKKSEKGEEGEEGARARARARAVESICPKDHSHSHVNKTDHQSQKPKKYVFSFLNDKSLKPDVAGPARLNLSGEEGEEAEAEERNVHK
jgi:hypothetical protein